MKYKKIIDYLLKIKNIVSIEKRSFFYSYSNELKLIETVYHDIINYIQDNKIPFYDFSEKTWDTIVDIDHILYSNFSNRKKIKKMFKLFD